MKIVLMLLLAIVFQTSAWCADARLFSFAQITDTHLHDAAWIRQQKEAGVKNGYRNTQTTPEKFRSAVQWLDRRGDVDFIVFTGDVVELEATEDASARRWGAFTNKMEGIKTPWVITAGNHDFRLERFMPADQSKGGGDFHFDWKGVQFLGFPTFNPHPMASWFFQMITKPTMEKMAFFLSTHKEAPTVLLCHAPLMDEKGNREGWQCPGNASQMMEVMKRCGNIVAVLCGHDHVGFWREEDGILYSTAPGFCEAYNGANYSFVLWHVYADRMMGEIYYVQDSGAVAKYEKNTEYKHDQITEIPFAFPERFRLKTPSAQAPWRVLPLPQPGTPILEEWFGSDWTYAPGLELPSSWKDDAILLAGKQDKPARMTESDGNASPAKDGDGREWYAPGYKPTANWTACTIPNKYSDQKKPLKARRLYFRIPFNVDRKDMERAGRFALKTTCSAGLVVYLNGKPFKVERNYGAGGSGVDVVPPSLLAPGENVLALSVQSSDWGGYMLDFEFSLQAK